MFKIDHTFCILYVFLKTCCSFYLDHKYVFDIIDVFIYAVIFTIALLFVIIITSIVTVVKLYEASRWRQQNGMGLSSMSKETKDSSSRLSSKEVAITRMLLASSLLFIVCFSPVVLLQLSIFLVPQLSMSGRYYNLLSVMWRLVSVLRMVNCSLNFIIYYLMGSRFRTTLWELLGVTSRLKGTGN